ncbi:calcium sensing receptor, chloroplastic [Dioscorea cayenensis subsp. rotundata]|uniref:Calcium sensing receptor, chloroplastic n=1 Tax=Dioscorea cayennensis subsp. rotundata TaxID=55577 RepID=A0AB40BVM1_DIOCR|nr:calcium sensing receptor, chloroplastic [Dioscorea cayenensis subsp. rotundata]
MAMAMAMALRAVAMTKPPPSSSPLKTNSKLHSPKHHHPPSLFSPSSTSYSIIALVSSSSSEAKALSFAKDDIVSSLTKVEETIDQVQDVGSKALDFSQSVIKTLVDVLKPGIDAALPVLRSAGDEALKVASPVVSEAAKQATEALQSAGVDPSPVITAAKTLAGAAQQTGKVVEGAKPIASATVQTISSADPSVIVVSAGALFIAYLILPPIWSVVSVNFRGYKGNLTPAQALDLISTQNYLMIDIRSEKDKNKAGIPVLPPSAKNKMISIPVEELPSKIKNLVRDSKKVEAEIVALKISYLKRVNKGSNIVIMDSYSGTAKVVARALTSLGFKNSWVMTDGFSGSRGWLQSRLGTASYNVSIAEILSPSRIIPASRTRFGTTSSAAVQSNQKLLPGSVDN